MRHMQADSVHCVVTSPPYWGLRSYQIDPLIFGGNPNCLHEWTVVEHYGGGWQSGNRDRWQHGSGADTSGHSSSESHLCVKGCGAWRGQLGLEPNIDLYLEHVVEVFEEVRRILHPSGTLWLNVGDAYITNPHGAGASSDPLYKNGRDRSQNLESMLATRSLGCNRTRNPESLGLKNKDLIMMPARVAMALQNRGWYLRAQIPWMKQNPTPESAVDRPTTMIEYVFLLAKSEDYFYDHEAVRIAASENSHSRGKGTHPKGNLPGPNSRMHRDRDPDHQTSAHKRAKQNRSFSASVISVVPTRVRRSYDWFMESIDGGAPVAFMVNPQAFTLQMCNRCEHIYEQAEWKRLPKNEEQDLRICSCGAIDWLSHFAVFPENLVTPMILAATSEKGACKYCGAQFERIVEKVNLGDFNPAAKKTGSHDKTAPKRMANWTKRDRPFDPEKIDPKGEQFTQRRMLASTYAARDAGGAHDSPFPIPKTIGWRLPCDHPLFPVETEPCIVFDPFAGTGTTLRVALMNGRQAIGVELSSAYIKLAHHRFASAKEKRKIAGAS